MYFPAEDGTLWNEIPNILGRVSNHSVSTGVKSEPLSVILTPTTNIGLLLSFLLILCQTRRYSSVLDIDIVAESICGKETYVSL